MESPLVFVANRGDVRYGYCMNTNETLKAAVSRECPVCGREVPVVNYDMERGYEVGYLGRHWRPGLPRTSKCRGSFGGWVGKCE